MNRVRVVINSAITKRGISGSARATHQVADALGELPGTTVELASPPWSKRSQSSMVNAVRDFWWDWQGAAKSADQPDLFISPCNMGAAPGARRHVLIIFDVMVFENPEYFDKRFAKYFQIMVPKSMRKADRILTLSEHSRTHLQRLVPNADIRIMTLPGRTNPSPPVRFPNAKTVLMVGGTHPHKNHVAGIHAVGDLRRSTDIDIRLRIVGPPERAEPQVQEAIASHDPSRDWISREIGLSDIEIDLAYGTSWILLQPSLNEGYGLPLVEAAQRGLPVVHSGRGAMPEVIPTGNANGVDAAAMGAAMGRLLVRDTWQREAAELLNFSRRFDTQTFPAHLADLLNGMLPTD